MTVMEVLALLNLLAVVIFGVITVTKKKWPSLSTGAAIPSITILLRVSRDRCNGRRSCLHPITNGAKSQSKTRRKARREPSRFAAGFGAGEGSRTLLFSLGS